MESRTKILFVCLGNICRSPLAEGVFKHLIAAEGLEDMFEVQSAGTGSWHIGQDPDVRTIQTAKGHGIILDHKGRQLKAADLTYYDYILAMDSNNLKNINNLASDYGITGANIKMMRDFDPEGNGDVPDPYFGEQDGFELVYNILLRSNKNLLQHLLER